jgi:hypothetical protein
VTPAKLEENYKNLPKKGDYLLTFTGGELATWFLRGVAPYYNEDSMLHEEGAYDMRILADKRETMPGIYWNVWTGRLSCEEHWLGYKLYQVLDDQPKFVWRGRYPDGWTEMSFSLTVNPSFGRPVVIKFSAPGEKLPQKLTIKRDGSYFEDYEILNTDEQTVELSEPVSKPVQFDFVLDRTRRPETPHTSQDSRLTGVLMRLDTMPAPHPPKGVLSCF